MSLTKRLYMPEIYEEIDGIKACNHANFNEYFEKCDDCGTTLEQLPQEMQDAWHEEFDEYLYGIKKVERAELPDDLPEEYVTPQELLMEQAEILRDSMREDGINV